MLFSIAHHPNVTANDLNHELNLISNCAYQWKMSFNPEPTKQAIELLFSHERTSCNHPLIYFNNSLVSRRMPIRIWDLHLIPDSHSLIALMKKINLANKIMGEIKYLSKHHRLKILDQMYKISIRPHIDYGNLIYHIPHSYDAFSSSVSLHHLME